MNIKIPVSWLRDYLKTDLAAKTLSNQLSLSGPSVERIEKHKEDFIFDVEVTSNRIDTASVWGLAKEAHVILSYNNQKSQLVSPKGVETILEPDRTQPLKLDVIIKNKNLCPRFTAIILDNVKIKPSPAIIKNRLETCGIRPINNIVDISNYIMLELGQPMHTFDYDKIKNAKMILRESTRDEKIITLDNQSRKLPQGAIVIEDQGRLIDLCGIMGGANSQISSRTKRVVLFVQTYNSQTIRKTTQALSFRTEAAARFEKGVDVEFIVQALSRAVYLAKKTSGAKIASELIDIYPEKRRRKQVTLSIKKLNSYLGIEISTESALKILKLLGFSSQASGLKITASAPSYRTEDVEEDVDLIEEIARIYGYHNLPSKLPQGSVSQNSQRELNQIIKLKEALKFLGLTEVITYSIISKELLNLTGIKEKDAVELANPLTEEWQFMRPTLIPSLATVIAKNQSFKKQLSIFEIAKTYEKKAGELPVQDWKIAFAVSNTDFYEIKGFVENLFEILQREPKFQNFSGKNPLSENSAFSLIKTNDQIVGGLGVLKEEVTDNMGIEANTYIAEVNLTKVFSQPKISKVYKPIPKYPPVIEDISAIFSVQTPLSDIIQETKKAGSPLVKNIEIIDVFEDEKLGENKKSITLRLTYQLSDKTPTQQEVTNTRNTITKHLEKSFLAKIRK